MPVEAQEWSIDAVPEIARAEARATVGKTVMAWLPLAGLWLLLFGTALFSPPLLDDADATHANAARHMALTGDWVTLHVNGIRYLEKAPLPYWLVALSFRLFGFNTFAAHLPQALAVLLLAVLGQRWATGAYGARAGLYTGMATITAAGVFLFTRIFIPEVLLSLLLCASLYFLLEALDKLSARAAYAMWTALAFAVLTKGLVALVFFFGAAGLYLIASGDLRRWRALRPFTGSILFLAIAAPWHIMAGLRNTGGANGHGFFWFYFVNEHVLRFLGKRQPMDYNKLPGYLFWSLHLVWLFPWSLLLPVLIARAVRGFRAHRHYCDYGRPTAESCPHSVPDDGGGAVRGRTGDRAISPPRRRRAGCAAATCGHLPGAHDAATDAFLRAGARLFFALDQSGILHVSGLSTAADAADAGAWGG